MLIKYVVYYSYLKDDLLTVLLSAICWPASLYLSVILCLFCLCAHTYLGKYVWMLCASDLCPGVSVTGKTVSHTLNKSFPTNCSLASCAAVLPPPANSDLETLPSTPPHYQHSETSSIAVYLSNIVTSRIISPPPTIKSAFAVNETCINEAAFSLKIQIN